MSDETDPNALCLEYTKYFPDDQTHEEFIADTLALKFINKIRGKLEKCKSAWLANHPEEAGPAAPERSATPASETSTSNTESSEYEKNYGKKQYRRVLFTFPIPAVVTHINPETICSAFEVPGVKRFAHIHSPTHQRTRIIGIDFLRRVTYGRVHSEMRKRFLITPNFELDSEETAAINAACPDYIKERTDEEKVEEPTSTKEDSILQRLATVEKLLARSVERIRELEALCGVEEPEEEKKKKKKTKKQKKQTTEESD